jgi:hypothetical protein
MKGLLVDIQGTDCTAGGVTSGHDKALLVGDGLPEIFDARDGLPVLRLEYDLFPEGAQPGRLMVAKPGWLEEVDPATERQPDDPTGFMRPDWVGRHRIVRAVARPIDHDSEKQWGMYGGHDVHTSDGRFPFTGPLPVHDRYE